MNSKKTIRIAIISSHPNQHLYTAFQCLAQVFGITSKVFYCFNTLSSGVKDPHFGLHLKWDIPLLAGYDHVFLNQGLPPAHMGFWETDSKNLRFELDAYEPDIVWIFGYNYLISLKAMLWAKSRKIPLFFLADSELSRKNRSFLIRMSKEVVVRFFFRLCSRFITIGDNNESYYRYYGVSSRRMIRGCYPIAVDRFSRKQHEYDEIRALTRKKLELQDNTITLLFLGKFIDIKRPLDLLEACGILKFRGKAFTALFLGAGPLLTTLEQRISKLGLQNEVRLLGFINQQAIPEHLMAGDILVVTSEADPHPLVVTEAMACGATAIVSDRVGCVGPTDILRPNITGLTYPCGNVETLANTIERLITDRKTLEKLRTNAKEWVQTQRPEVLAAAVIKAVLSLGVEPDYAARFSTQLKNTLKTSLSRLEQSRGRNPMGAPS